MKLTSQKQRLGALFDAYLAVVKMPLDTEKVYAWAAQHGLTPVPDRDASAGECDAWERNLRAICHEKR